MSDFKLRMLEEARELAKKTNALNDFMHAQGFVDLDRVSKDLLCEQYRAMNIYLRILSKRLELLGEDFTFKKEA